MAGNSRMRKLVRPYAIEDGRRFRLADHDPGDTNGLESKERAEKWLAKGVERLRALQEKLYAQDRWAVLLVFQAMDAAGKDSVIKHVMSGINPQGCEVTSFKAPTSDDLDHDFLWRTARCLPQRGRIGIFNRSYYEEVLVVRVHPEILAKQKLPSKLVAKRIWQERYQDIASHERYLARNGVLILKFFLHVSKAEQKKRFLERIDEPEKNWKFSSADVAERTLLEEVHDGLRGHDPRDGGAARAVVRGARRQEMVRPARGRGRRCRRDGRLGSRLPGPRRGPEGGPGRGAP